MLTLANRMCCQYIFCEHIKNFQKVFIAVFFSAFHLLEQQNIKIVNVITTIGLVLWAHKLLR